MMKKILLSVAIGVCAAAYMYAFEYLEDGHQGLLIFASLMVAIAAGRRSKSSSNTVEV